MSLITSSVSYPSSEENSSPLSSFRLAACDVEEECIFFLSVLLFLFNLSVRRRRTSIWLSRHCWECWVELASTKRDTMKVRSRWAEKELWWCSTSCMMLGRQQLRYAQAIRNITYSLLSCSVLKRMQHLRTFPVYHCLPHGLTRSQDRPMNGVISCNFVFIVWRHAQKFHGFILGTKATPVPNSGLWIRSWSNFQISRS